MEIAPPGDVLAATVSDREYARLLRWPRERPFEGRIGERVAESRAWYATSGRPWAVFRRVAVQNIEGDDVALESGATFHGASIAQRLREASAHAIFAVALTAGAEVERAAAQHWAEGRPDEGFFLDRFGTAVTEELVRWLMVHACREVQPDGETVLFHQSPGCSGWPLSDQATLMSLLAPDGSNRVGPVSMLESGALSPSYSLLAAFAIAKGIASRVDATDACRACDMPRCAYRRAPYRRNA